MRKNHSWSRHLSAAAVLATSTGLGASPLQAQTPTGGSEAAPVAASEIIVTAQRRNELIEDVPMAISVITSEAVANAGVENFMDLGKIAPGVQMDYSGSVPGVSVRGVSTTIAGYNVEPNVAVYIDGFYEPQPLTLAADIANLESVQVLKGPQGTLYGRNATGGAILITTLGPSRTPTAKLDLSYARFDTVTANAYVAGPITEGIRYSVTGHIRHGDLSLRQADRVIPGATDGSAGEFDYKGLRARVEADLGENLVATIGFNYSKASDGRANYFSTYEYIPPTLPPPPARPTRFGVVANDFGSVARGETLEGTLKLELTTGIGTLTSYTGYANRDLQINDDFDGTYVPIVDLEIGYKQNTWQQTVDFAIDTIDRLKLNVGGIYYHDVLDQPGDKTFSTYLGGNLASVTRIKAKSSAWAIYVDGSYDITDRLVITLGGRFNHDRKSLDFQTQAADGSFLIAPLYDSQSWSQFTPRATLRYELASRTNVYASVSRGYRAGAYNTQGPVFGALEPAQPEKITAYEVGFKTAGPNLRFSAAAFYYDYTNLQVTVTVPSADGQSVSAALLNAPGAKIKGAEAELSFNPVRNLTLRGAITVLDAEYTTFTNAVGTGVNAANTLNVGNQAQDWTGQQLARAPDLTASAGFDYELPTDAGTFVLTGTASYSDGYVIGNGSLYGPLAPPDLRNKQRYRQDSFVLVSAQLSWTDPTDHLTLAVFGNNLTNESYRLSYNGGNFGDYSAKADPRTYGIRIGYKY